MISQVAQHVVYGYVKEVCSILNFDESNVRVLFVKQIPSIAGIPQHATITYDSCLVLDETWVNQQIKQETPTSVRAEVYGKVRMLYRHAKQHKSPLPFRNDAINEMELFTKTA